MHLEWMLWLWPCHKPAAWSQASDESPLNLSFSSYKMKGPNYNPEGPWAVTSHQTGKYHLDSENLLRCKNTALHSI